MFSKFFNNNKKEEEIIDSDIKINKDKEEENLTTNNDELKFFEKEIIKKRKIQTIIEDDLDNINCQFYEAKIRNILFVGATKSGKTTLLNILKNPKYFDTDKPTLFSTTRYAKLRCFVTEDNLEHYCVNIIDTPGLFEITKDETKRRTNEEIISLIMDCLRNEITKIHKIFFVFSKLLGLQPSNVDSINILLERFPAFEDKCALIMTNCEDILEEDIEVYTNDLKCSKIKNINKMPILFSGCIKREDKKKK